MINITSQTIPLTRRTPSTADLPPVSLELPDDHEITIARNSSFETLSTRLLVVLQKIGQQEKTYLKTVLTNSVEARTENQRLYLKAVDTEQKATKELNHREVISLQLDEIEKRSKIKKRENNEFTQLTSPTNELNNQKTLESLFSDRSVDPSLMGQIGDPLFHLELKENINRSRIVNSENTEICRLFLNAEEKIFTTKLKQAFNPNTETNKVIIPRPFIVPLTRSSQIETKVTSNQEDFEKYFSEFFEDQKDELSSNKEPTPKNLPSQTSGFDSLSEEEKQASFENFLNAFVPEKKGQTPVNLRVQMPIPKNQITSSTAIAVEEETSLGTVNSRTPTNLPEDPKNMSVQEEPLTPFNSGTQTPTLEMSDASSTDTLPATIATEEEAVQTSTLDISDASSTDTLPATIATEEEAVQTSTLNISKIPSKENQATPIASNFSKPNLTDRAESGMFGHLLTVGLITNIVVMSLLKGFASRKA